jgi:hypothetical protein
MQSAYHLIVADTLPIITDVTNTENDNVVAVHRRPQPIDTMILLPNVSILQRPVYTIESRHLSDIRRQWNPDECILPTLSRLANNVMYSCRQSEYSSKVRAFFEQTHAYAIITADVRRASTTVRRRVQCTLDALLSYHIIDALQHARLSPTVGQTQPFDQLNFLPDIRRVRSHCVHSHLITHSLTLFVFFFFRRWTCSSMCHLCPCCSPSLVQRWP